LLSIISDVEIVVSVTEVADKDRISGNEKLNTCPDNSDSLSKGEG
jgi:hypothetical protein